MAFDNLLKVLIIAVYDADFALTEKHGFAGKIMCEISVLVRSDMIGFDICKDTVVKNKALCSVKHQSL